VKRQAQYARGGPGGCTWFEDLVVKFSLEMRFRLRSGG
jgi:hypothetical protein